jgi:hypothetical protein
LLRHFALLIRAALIRDFLCVSREQRERFSHLRERISILDIDLGYALVLRHRKNRLRWTRFAPKIDLEPVSSDTRIAGQVRVHYGTSFCDCHMHASFGIFPAFKNLDPVVVNVRVAASGTFK